MRHISMATCDNQCKDSIACLSITIAMALKMCRPTLTTHGPVCDFIYILMRSSSWRGVKLKLRGRKLSNATLLTKESISMRHQVKSKS